jgi:4-hydroxythreonine-4-phosphate dehydrogenase
VGLSSGAVLYQPLPDVVSLPEVGTIGAEAGHMSRTWVLEGARLALEGAVDGLVTGPIHKEAWRMAGAEHPGHTETLRDHAGVERVLMLLVGGRLRAALATIHTALRHVPAMLSTPELLADILLLHREIGRLFGPPRPRIAVTGLNPHAGEGGLFGREENEVIEPAVQAARGRGVDAYGPLPADGCIPAAVGGGWDAVLAMFHDQALPAVKAVAPRRGVNVTLGLPYLRTSVDHGTAFEIAGTGRAVASSLRAAIDLAVDALARRDEPALNAGGAASDLVE